MPKKIPTPEEKAAATITVETLIWAAKPMAPQTALAPSAPSTIPIRPPISVMMPASARNCHKIDFVLAPKDFRMPISLVRSVTDTSMIFITPMPPTKREMAATKEINRVSIPRI